MIQKCNSNSTWGRFSKFNNHYWVFHIPEINDTNKNIFLNNLRCDVTDDKIYLVLANLFETIPKDNMFYPELSRIFYNLFYDEYNKNEKNKLILYPSLCNIPVSDIKYSKGKFLSFYDNNNDYIYEFMKKFESYIMENKYNLLLNNFNLRKSKFNENKQLLQLFEALVNRCKIDNNPAFLYSILGKKFYDLISQSFLQLNFNIINIFFNIVQLPVPHNDNV